MIPLIRIMFRQDRRHPLRTALLVLGIALGVSGVVAIDIARTSVSRSFDLSTATLTSRSSHQIVGSRFTVPQDLFTQIRTRLGIYRSAPVITAHIRIREFEDRTLTFMGMDPFSEVHFRQYTLASPTGDAPLESLLGSGSGVLVSGVLARGKGLKKGDRLTLLFGSREVSVRISGFLDSRDATSNTVFQGVILADISLAQEILGMGDTISRIDLTLESDREAEAVRYLLPPGVFLVETDRQNQVVRQLSRSFETSLTAFSMLALFMGIFLIYNTVSFSVTRRRKLIGSLRALGARREDIFRTIMAEVTAFAVIGSILGLLLGILMGKGAVRAVCTTVSDMYFVLTVSQTAVTFPILFKGFAAGILSAFAASFVPSLNAAKTLPITLMQPSSSESRLKDYLFHMSLAGLMLVGLAAWLLTRGVPYAGIDFIGVFMIFLGAAFLSPVFILFFVRAGLTLIRKRSGVMIKMAFRNIARSLSRTSVLIASLMVVTSVYIGIGVMTGSFRLSIIDWVDANIGGDIHVSSSDTLAPSLDPALMDRIRALPEVSGISAYNIHRIFSRKSGEVHLFSYVRDLSRKKWSWTAGDETSLTGLLDQGWIFVSEIFAQVHGIQPDTPDNPDGTLKAPRVTLETLKGPVTFRVAGIFRDFFMGGGRAIVSRQTMETYWGHNDITAMQVFLKKGTRIGPVQDRIESMLPVTSRVRVVSGQSIKQGILDVFDKTFLITSALQVLTAIVALTGILNSVTALLLERTREMGILRACGTERGQIGRLMLWECALSGFISGILALPLGTGLSWILIHVVNLRSFGWTYDMVLSPLIFFEALALATVAALAAGIFPAVRAGRMDIAGALHME